MKRRALMVGGLALALGARLGSRARAECAATTLELALVGDGIARPPSLAVLAEHRNALARSPADPAAVLVLASGLRPRFREERIVPGLVRLVLAAPLPPGTHRFERAHSVDTLVIAAGPALPPLAAPIASALEWRDEDALGEPQRLLRAALRAPVPPSACAIVVRSDDGRAATWNEIVPGATEAVVHAPSSRCARVPEGQRAPERGVRARLAFVDLAGQTSPWSAPLEVR